MRSSRPPNAAAGSPPEIALARQTRSGCTPNRSVAPPAAMVKPVLISSKMNTTPYLVHSSRTRLR